MNRLITLSYDGSYFHGWQIQDNAYTVQECFQKALFKIIGKEVDIKACSRTDTGVHAKVFCVSTFIDSPIPDERLVGALNHFLPNYVSCLNCTAMPEDFHARYSSNGKEYVYLIYNKEIRDPFLDKKVFHYWYPIDVEKLNAAAKHYIGTHDFTSFCTIDARKSDDLVRTVYDARVEKEGDMVKFTVSANGFLYNMVRIMVGTLIKVQQGKLDPQDIPGIIEGKNRKLAGTTAPAQGLYLQKVFYEDFVVQ